MTVARKFFSETVTLTGNQAISVLALMQAAGWGFEPGANNAIGTTTPSMDSTIGTGLTLIPSAAVYVGNDQYVRDQAQVGPPRTYRGVLVAAGVPYTVNEYTRGLVDLGEVWLWSLSPGQSLEIVFKGI